MTCWSCLHREKKLKRVAWFPPKFSELGMNHTVWSNLLFGKSFNLNDAGQERYWSRRNQNELSRLRKASSGLMRIWILNQYIQLWKAASKLVDYKSLARYRSKISTSMKLLHRDALKLCDDRHMLNIVHILEKLQITSERSSLQDVACLLVCWTCKLETFRV